MIGAHTRLVKPALQRPEEECSLWALRQRLRAELAKELAKLPKPLALSANLRRPWTDYRDARLTRMYRAQVPIREMARVLRVSQEEVRRRLRVLDPEVETVRRGWPLLRTLSKHEMRRWGSDA